MSNTYDADDAGTQWHLDRGGSDPTFQAWSEERSRVADDPFHDDWKSRDNEDVEHATRAAWDEVKSRDERRGAHDRARPHLEWARQEFPGTTTDRFARDMLAWHKLTKADPDNGAEYLARWGSAQYPFRPRPRVTAKDEPPDYLDARGRIEWQRDQDVRDGVRAAPREREHEDDHERNQEIYALIKEDTGLEPDQFFDIARQAIEQLRIDPHGTARKIAMNSGAPRTEREAQERIQTAQHAQATEAKAAWLTQARQQNLLPADYDALEGAIGAELTAMTQEGNRTWDDLTDIHWARDRAIQRQQMTGAVDPQVQQWVLTAYNALLAQGLGSDYAMQKARELVQAAYHDQQQAAHAERAKRASRSVSGAPSSPDAGPAMKRDPNMSYDDDLRQDIVAAVRSSSAY